MNEEADRINLSKYRWKVLKAHIELAKTVLYQVKEYLKEKTGDFR